MTAEKSAASKSTVARRQGLDPKIVIGLAVVILFFLASGFVAYQNVLTLRDDNQLIVHTQDVMSALQGVLMTEQDAETGQRGFLLTNNERYLEPYNAAVAAIAARIEEIRNLTLDNPRQQARLGPLKQHVDAKMAELKETVDLRRSQGLDAALAVVTTDRGKGEMDAIRAQIAAMTQEEQNLRDRRIAEMMDAYRTAFLSGILSGLLGIVLTLIVGYLMRRTAVARQRQLAKHGHPIDIKDQLRASADTGSTKQL